MKPLFQILANDEDVTDKIADRLLSLRVIDEDGLSADRVEISLDDRDGLLELPETGFVLDVSLGSDTQGLHYMGKFVVSGVSGNFPVRTMTISAMAADLLGSIRSAKTRSWENASIASIVNTIAGENNLIARVGDSVANTVYPFLAQHAESDLHFLTRIAREIDATAKPSGGHLVVHKRGETETAAGDPMRAAEIAQERISDGSWKMAEREVYATVEAEWGDVTGGATQRVTAGSGDPKRRLRHVYSNAAVAQRAADAELAMSGRSRMSLKVNIAGFEPNVFAGGLVKVTPAIRPELDGDWHVNRVEHELKKSLTTKVSAVKALTS